MVEDVKLANIEELLGLPPEGWQKVAAMTDDELAEYLKDITSLEPKMSAVNILPQEPEETEKEDDSFGSILSTLDKLKKDAQDPNSPFAKKRKKSPTAKGGKKSFAINKSPDELTDSDLDNILNNL